MLLHFEKHGKQAEGGLLSVCGLKKSINNDSTYWANVSETARMFLFVKEEKADLVLLNKETGRFVTLCVMTRKGKSWRGVFGWLYFQAKPSPAEAGPELVLYYSNRWSG